MALALQAEYCVIQNQHFSNAEISDDLHSILEAIEEVDTEQVEVNDLFTLIRNHSKSLKQASISGCLCVLLPAISERSVLKNLTYELFAVLGRNPDLEIYLYPYGEPSFLMSLARINREAQAAKPVWILALNTKCTDVVNSHDSFILAACTEQSPGVTFGGALIDLDSVKQDIAVEKVVKQLGISSRKEISDLAFTLDGDEPLWLNHLDGLSPWITPNTQYHFSDIKIAALGACNGLLKAISLYHQQKLQPNSDFQALQLDVEPGGYVAGTIFGWSND